jgi:hypothetical protein
MDNADAESGFVANRYKRTNDPKITDEMMRLKALLEKRADADLVRAVVG